MSRTNSEEPIGGVSTFICSCLERESLPNNASVVILLLPRRMYTCETSVLSRRLFPVATSPHHPQFTYFLKLDD
jgi:hypothetical protein